MLLHRGPLSLRSASTIQIIPSVSWPRQSQVAPAPCRARPPAHPLSRGERLSETTGVEAKTIHRLLEVNPASGGFTRNEARPQFCQILYDGLVVNETPMVDRLLMNNLLRALPATAASSNARGKQRGSLLPSNR